jgi:hypothetical protein
MPNQMSPLGGGIGVGQSTVDYTPRPLTLVHHILVDKRWTHDTSPTYQINKGCLGPLSSSYKRL